jgi:hypothetical protein
MISLVHFIKHLETPGITAKCFRPLQRQAMISEAVNSCHPSKWIFSLTHTLPPTIGILITLVCTHTYIYVRKYIMAIPTVETNINDIN